jgi:predicted RNase H-like HicB family nuclease
VTRRVGVSVQQTGGGFIAHAIGLQGVIVSDGASLEEALSNLKSAIAFHLETFGPGVLGPPLASRHCGIQNAEVILDV